MNAADNGTATIPCPRCQTANISVARFCLTCGSPLQAGVSPQPAAGPPPLPMTSQPQLPPMIPMPPSAPSFSPSGYLSGSAGGGTGQTLINLDINSAFSAALQAIQTVGGTVQGKQPPSLIRFEMSKRSFATTLGARIRFDCELFLSPAGPRQTAARMTSKLSSSGSTTLMSVCAGLAVLFWWTAISVKAPLWGVIGTAAAAGSYWMVSGKGPGEMVQRVVTALMSAQPMISPPRLAESRTPPPLPVYSQTETPAPASVGATGNVFEQLKQLGALRDAGIITGDEFENKKADLLKRV